MFDTFAVRRAVIEAVENAYLGCWSYGRDPRVVFCDVDVWSDPKEVSVRGELEFTYRRSDVFMEQSFKQAVRNAYDDLKRTIAEALREYAKDADDPDLAGEWIINLEHMKTSLSEE